MPETSPEALRDKLLRIAKLISSAPPDRDADLLDTIAAICSDHAPEARHCVLIKFHDTLQARAFFEQFRHHLSHEYAKHRQYAQATYGLGYRYAADFAYDERNGVIHAVKGE